MCAACNALRAACGHCWGVVACVQAVAATERIDVYTVLRQWELNLVMPVETAEDPAARRVRLGADYRRKENAKEAVRLGMTVHRIGVDEFIWPADSAAKRVWNLATLARGGYTGPPPTM